MTVDKLKFVECENPMEPNIEDETVIYDIDSHNTVNALNLKCMTKVSVHSMSITHQYQLTKFSKTHSRPNPIYLKYMHCEKLTGSIEIRANKIKIEM